MRKLSLLLSLIVIVAMPQLAMAENFCTGNPKPDKLTIGVYFIEDQGKVVSSIAVGNRIHMNATPKVAADNCQTPGSGQIKWTLTPADLVSNGPGDGDFTPTYTAAKNGTFNIQATLDGVFSNVLPVTIGSGGTTTGSGTGSMAETYAYCAYKRDNKTVCINSSSTDVSCTSTPECKTNGGCTRVLLDKCSNGGADFCKDAALPNPPAQDLGQLISQLFTWSLSILGISIFIVMLYSGTQWILAAGNTSKIGAAQGRMKDAAIAAVFLLSSYVILKALNPDFVSQSTTLPSFQSTSTTTSPFVKSCSTVAPAPTTAK